MLYVVTVYDGEREDEVYRGNDREIAGLAFAFYPAFGFGVLLDIIAASEEEN